jgi:hypothetical protein
MSLSVNAIRLPTDRDDHTSGGAKEGGRCAPGRELVVSRWLCWALVVPSLNEFVQNGFQVGPNYQRPPAPVAPTWIDADNPRWVPQRHERTGR